MAKIHKKTKRYPSDLTDEKWSAVEPVMRKSGSTEPTAPVRSVKREPLSG